MHVKKGDTVVVLTGDARGETGRVLKVLPEKNKVIVEGLNFVTRHTRPTQTNPQGGRLEKEAPLHASNVKVIAEG
ncbi:MAG: 50S ribosomal protein L24 [Gemmatimonadota bacterium]|nr:50S ribosomal protein L24 [Gemmatimonadota bacterium]MDE2727326.1 50S ribosomal protein L24 [Gemmatimonadota bacterium]MDE2848573.1 50S ribosomal protein L24 [Gemmatimonadota bacterium]MXW05021.1 50S ribosomal protein L24 [Gemmatimonadota bacterium]MXY48345.1 50S ribosomal protein L24 [Gemmatimonadota bacterium]